MHQIPAQVTQFEEKTSSPFEGRFKTNFSQIGILEIDVVWRGRQDRFYKCIIDPNTVDVFRAFPN